MDKRYLSWRELAYAMENDFVRYPIPVEFDAYNEIKALSRRINHIEAVAKRWFSIYKRKTQTNG